MVDRRGQTPVPARGAPVAAAAIVPWRCCPRNAATGVDRRVRRRATGSTQPPVGACMRALWPDAAADGADRRHAAYALEGVALEVVYICGPVVIVAGIGSLVDRRPR